MLKIYSVQLHEKYQPVPVVSRCSPCHTSTAAVPLVSLPIVPARRFFPLHVPTVPTLRVLSSYPLYLLFLAFMRPYVPRFARTSLLFIFQRYDATRQRLARRTISRSRLCILRGGVGDIINWRRRRSACRGASNSEWVSDYVTRKTSGINRELAQTG